MNYAAGGLKLDPVTLLLPHQAASEGGLIGNAAEDGVGLLTADDLIRFLVLFAHFADGHAAADGNNGTGRHIFENDGVFDQVHYLGDLGVELALLGLRLIVFAVLRQIAERAGFLDLLGNLFLPNGLKVFQLLFSSSRRSWLILKRLSTDIVKLPFDTYMLANPAQNNSVREFACYYTESRAPCQDDFRIPFL